MPIARETTPDGLGGLLLTWETLQGTPGRTLTRFDTAWARQDAALDPNDTLGAGASAGARATVWTLAGASLRAFDVETLTPVWAAASVAGVPVIALDEGVLVSDGASLTVLDEAGAVVSMTAGSIRDATIAVMGHNVVHGLTTETASLVALALPDFLEAGFSFQLKGTSPGAQGCRNPAKPPLDQRPPFASQHKGLVPRDVPYSYEFVDTAAGVWTAGQRGAVAAGFDLWNAANAVTGLSTRFRERLSGEGPAALRLVKATLAASTTGTTNTDLTALVNGRFVDALVSFSNNTNFLNANKGYYKVALHEGGHLLGLGDNLVGINPQTQEGISGTKGSSVMNYFGKQLSSGPLPPITQQDDFMNNLPNRPTVCDREKPMRHPFFRGVLCAITIASGLLGAVSAQNREPRVRSLEPSHTPIPERLLPDDELIVIRSTGLLVQDSTWSNAAELLADHVGASTLVVTGQLLAVEPRLSSFWASSVERVLRFRVTNVLIARPGYWRRLRPGEEVEAGVEGGEMKVAHALVRVLPAAPYEQGQEYLLFLGRADVRFKPLGDLLPLRDGRIRTLTKEHPLNGARLKDLESEIKRLERII